MNSCNKYQKVIKIVSNTTRFWIKKLFLVLEYYQDDIVLSDKIWIDKTYFKVVKKRYKIRKDRKEF